MELFFQKGLDLLNSDTYSTSKRISLRDKATLSTRKRIYKTMALKLPMEELDSIIDVGVTADKKQESSNFFEKLYPYSDRITAFSDQDASWMEDVYNGLKFVRGDGLNMPFDDNSFELVFSSAVLEHVGSRENQRQFIKECMRISKKYVFLTTPNKWYPIELHTALPFLHWLPSKAYRTVLKQIGLQFFVLEENLNLLDRKIIVEMINNIGNFDFSIFYERFLGLPSNILVLVKK